MASKSNKSGILLALLVLLLAAAGLLMYNQVQKQKTILKQEQELAKKEKLTYQLNNQVDSMINELEIASGESMRLNEIVMNQKTEIELQKRKISQLIRTKRDFDQAKKEMAALQSQMSDYKGEIEDMRRQISRLKEDNQLLNSKNDELIEKVAIQSEKNENLLMEKGKLEETKSELENKNEKLSQKVTRASAINIEITEVEGIKLKNNGKRGTTRRADKMSGMDICVLLENNPLVSDGEEVFFLRVVDPGGETVTGQGENTTSNMDTDTKMRFSAQYVVDYAAQSEECFRWEPEIPFQEGEYTVEVYNKGYLMAQQNFTAK